MCKFNICKLPEDLLSIGNDAFAYCKSLSSIEIPAGVKNIGERAFDRCADDFVMKGYEGTAAQTYAMNNGITFELI